MLTKVSVCSSTLNWLIKRTSGILVCYLYGFLTFWNRHILHSSEMKCGTFGDLQWLSGRGVGSRHVQMSAQARREWRPEHGTPFTLQPEQYICAVRHKHPSQKRLAKTVPYTWTRFKTTRLATLIFDSYWRMKWAGIAQSVWVKFHLYIPHNLLQSYLTICKNIPHYPVVSDLSQPGKNSALHLDTFQNYSFDDIDFWLLWENEMGRDSSVELQVFHTVHLSSIILRITNRCHFFW